MIHCLVPDLPSAEELTPWLQQIDQNRWYTNFGPLERRFVVEAARLLDQAVPPQVAALSSGTDALILALQALELAKDARVLVPALTFPATASAVIAAGFCPVLADVDPLTWSLTPALAEASADQVDVVMPVAAYGCALPAPAWDDFVKRTGLPVVMDAAAAFTRQPMPRLCTVVFSLHATKSFGIGEGGLVASYDAALIARVVQRSNFGFQSGRVHFVAGNSKFSEYAAAVGLAQLARLPTLRDRYRKLNSGYERLSRGVWRQQGLPGLLVIAVDDATRVAGILKQSGIETRTWYQPILPEHPPFADLPRATDLATCRFLNGRLLGMPFHNHLSVEDITYVCDVLEQKCADHLITPPDTSSDTIALAAQHSR